MASSHKFAINREAISCKTPILMVLLKLQEKIQLIDASENKPAASDTQCTESSVWQMPNLLFQRTLVQAEPRAGVCS